MCYFSCPNSLRFTLKIHHGGKIMNVGGRNTYWGGDCCFVDNYDLDKVSIIELDVLIKENLVTLLPLFII